MESPYTLDYKAGSVDLNDPLSMPKAGGFLWNKKMMLQMNCRGYAVSQFMQPEPGKYAQGPALEASTFMQPEHHYYSHHPGRFFYIKNHQTEQVFSVPFEPMRVLPNEFKFRVFNDRLEWTIRHDQLEVNLRVQLTPNDTAELWEIAINNLSSEPVSLSVYPYFPFGYQSWMNQSADYCDKLKGIVANKVTPYQQLADYWKNAHLKELSFFVSDKAPSAWCANANQFEGVGGLTMPDGITANTLNNSPACYDVPVAAMQYNVTLEPQHSHSQRFMFGAAKDVGEIQQLQRNHLGTIGLEQENRATTNGFNPEKTALEIQTDDPAFDQFINLWLPRQVFYHGDVDRLTTDPQTRNYLQDGMGMIYVDSARTREKLIRTLSQQFADGSLPDGVLLNDSAQLKYINTIPHSDHCVWLPMCLHAYICETGDMAILNVRLPFADDTTPFTVYEHVERAMAWLEENLDERGLSLIQQGDWCDPMNMVGYKGKGVSAWLSMASSYAWQRWADICEWSMHAGHAKRWRHYASEININIQTYFWKDNWYARGITDAGRVFGTHEDKEGSIYLNPQTWAMMAGVVDSEKTDALINKVEQLLGTRFGVAMLSPAYTSMVEDIGRLTQKFPGTAENGSIYNHAAAFYAYALFQQGKSEQGYTVLKRMLVSKQDATQREQLPVFIPNYYRGAVSQYPSHAGRSSQLFNTGTVAWFYRSIIEGLFGLIGTPAGLKFAPQLPKKWQKANVTRRFRGATFVIQYTRTDTVNTSVVYIDDTLIADNVFREAIAGKRYKVDIHLPVYKDGA
ncbi:MAG: hypothetical protein WA981_03355 [Glaciecola sp.]